MKKYYKDVGDLDIYDDALVGFELMEGYVLLIKEDYNNRKRFKILEKVEVKQWMKKNST